MKTAFGEVLPPDFFMGWLYDPKGGSAAPMEYFERKYGYIPTKVIMSKDVDFQERFGGIQRLYGKQAIEILKNLHVCVVGLGGVGSWAVEALARTGIG